MTAELARAAGPVGAAGLVALLLAPARTHRLAGLAAWALAALALAVYLAPKGHTAVLAAAAVAGIVVAAAGAALLLRWPWLLALATLACVPARIPVTIGSTQANLLIPLYAVVAAAALALAWQLVQGDASARELGPVALPLAAFVGWTGLSLAWTQDLRQGAVELLAFYLPFGLLAVALRGAGRRRPRRRGLRVAPARASAGRARGRGFRRRGSRVAEPPAPLGRAEPDHQRPLEARRQRDQARRPPSRDRGRHRR